MFLAFFTASEHNLKTLSEVADLSFLSCVKE